MKHKIVLVLILTLLLSSCGALTPNDNPIEVTDSIGHTAVLNGVPERIAIAGKATIMVQDAIYLFPEAADRVVAVENRNQSAYAFLPVIDPGLDEKEIFDKNVGPEQIAAVNPDLVLMKNFMLESMGEPLAQLDIPTLYLDLETPDAFYQDLRTLGKVFGNDQRAETLISYYQERVTRVEEMVAEVSQDQKPSVLVLQYSDDGGEVAYKVPPVSWLQTRLVELAGGDPAWKDLEMGGGWAIVNLEQIAAWDPEIMIMIDYSGNGMEVKEQIVSSPLMSSFGAIENGQFFVFGFDFYSWDQPDTRWILGLQWLATKIQPDLTAEIDIMEEVESFYTELYGLDQEVIESEVFPRLTGDIP